MTTNANDEQIEFNEGMPLDEDTFVREVYGNEVIDISSEKKYTDVKSAVSAILRGESTVLTMSDSSEVVTTPGYWAYVRRVLAASTKPDENGEPTENGKPK